MEPATRRPQVEREAILVSPGFGSNFSNHMVLIDWNPERGWRGHRIIGYAPFTLDPASAALHYAQEAFEGLKAYTHEDGSIWRFRTDVSAARFRRPTRRLALPELGTDDFLAGISRLVEVDRDWAPRGAKQDLYLRPFMFAHSVFLAVKPSTSVTYAVTTNLSGACFGGSGVQSVKIWVSRDFSRAAPGGTGFAECGGNYTASMAAQQEAETARYSQVTFLDTVERRYVEELGGMNPFVVTTDSRVITPAPTSSVLEGVTRSAVLRLATGAGLTIEERRLPQQELHRGIDDDSIHEVLTCDTAAIITPMASFTDPDGTHTMVDGQPDATAFGLRRQLTEIQYGRRPDPCDWMHRII